MRRDFFGWACDVLGMLLEGLETAARRLAFVAMTTLALGCEDQPPKIGVGYEEEFCLVVFLELSQQKLL